MTPDTALAVLSDRLFMSAVAVYALAMLAHAAEYARERTTSLIPAGAPTPGAARRTATDRLGRVAVALTVLGAVLHLGSIVARGVATARWPLGNMYEFDAAICLFAVAGWLAAVRTAPSLRRLGVFVLVPVLMLMFLGGTVLYAAAAPVTPPLQTFWLAIHVTTVASASGLLLVAGAASVAYLVSRSDRATTAAPRLVTLLPPPEALDRVAYRVTTVAFPLFTFAVVAGAIWAEAAWGRFWGWDPKETVAFVSWVVYSAYLHARATAGWRAERAAWINTLGFATMVVNLFCVNLVVAGLHSYAGL
ncbi:c-type cytochrome biogenesis protein CcsB [Pseudonocardia sp. TRM90224]|uniref:c-type cytochrome biogenesis protein CcsB n=1 Tax=Pseudonocardia sp. TRM90224 TaxID=2812678 RepID=UPI001E2A215D|nr:c-type cytochrome biogenesis protein CcsB [Pseudonocardia sp. TRM90224]